MDKPILAKDIMITKLITLTPDMDVLEAIGMLLKHRISGAPVLDADHRILLGQISRRDLLQAGNKSLQFRTNLPQEKNLLYLSGIMNREESPIS